MILKVGGINFVSAIYILQIYGIHNVESSNGGKSPQVQFANQQCEETVNLKPCPGFISSSWECVHEGCCWDDNQKKCLAKEGMLRLYDGQYKTSGRLEIFHDGEWGTVCDDDWTEAAAEVACYQMGYHQSRPRVDQAYYNTISRGRIMLDDIECSGDETSLVDCEHRPLGTSDCEHGEDIGLMCEHMNEDGEIRLVGGPDDHSGRVEIFHHGRFGTVCDDGWDHYSADVLCRQLGYTSGFPTEGSFFGPGSGTIWLDDIHCSGGESDISSCKHSNVGPHDCTHDEDAGVICGADSIEMIFMEGELRLTGASKNDSGLVELYHAGQWGRICAQRWSDVEADLTCRQLGYVSGSVSNKIFTKSETPDFGWLTKISCKGSEQMLHFCDHGLWNQYDCSGQSFSAVQCDDTVQEILDLEKAPPVIDKMRLAGAKVEHRGRVEIFINGKFGTVCDDGFDNNAAAVVCRSLGYISGVSAPGSSFGKGDGPIWLDDVFCEGDESRLEECSHRIWGTHDCSHDEDAAVMCQIGDGVENKQ